MLPVGFLVITRHTVVRVRSLDELRAEHGWSQAELARRVGVSRQSINAVETGKYDPSLPLAFRLAREFGIAVEELFDDEAHERASRWFAKGIQLCLDTGDPESLVDQLLDLRTASLRALGRDPDEIQQRGERFLEEKESEELLAPGQ